MKRIISIFAVSGFLGFFYVAKVIDYKEEGRKVRKAREQLLNKDKL